jgi:hypothetical protein
VRARQTRPNPFLTDLSENPRAANHYYCFAPPRRRFIPRNIRFQPGTYGSSAAPLNFQVGYYTSVAGLGRSPTDVSITGSINVYNQCAGSFCVALNNFWRSLSSIATRGGMLGRTSL